MKKNTAIKEQFNKHVENFANDFNFIIKTHNETVDELEKYINIVEEIQKIVENEKITGIESKLMIQDILKEK